MANTIKVLIKGLGNVIEFPEDTAMDVIEKSIKGNWNDVEKLSGLPMDTASVLSRRKELGFRVTAIDDPFGDIPTNDFFTDLVSRHSSGELNEHGIREPMNAFGLRVMSVNPSTGKREIANLGDEIPNSFVWDDGVSTDEALDGASTLGINWDGFDVEDIDETLKELSSYLGDGDQVVLVGGTGGEAGNDIGEIIIEDPRVIHAFGRGTLDKIRQIPKNTETTGKPLSMAGGTLAAGAVGVGALTASDESQAATGQPQEPTTWEQVKDLFTGNLRTTPEIEGMEEIGDAKELNELSMSAFKTSLGLLTTGDTEKLKTLITNNIPSAKFRADSKGNTIVDLPSGSFALDKPGFSPQDMARTAFDIASFVGAGRAATGAATTLRGAELGAGVGGLTRLGIDVAGQAAGTSNDVSLGNVNAGDVALETVLGGVARPLEKAAKSVGGLAKSKLRTATGAE